jgi:hypothetical protein
MASVRDLLVTIGGPEVTPGTAVARTKVVPIRGVPTLRSDYETGPDPAITGSNIIRGKYALSKNVGGSIPLAIRPIAGIGMILNSLLGQEPAPVQIGGALKLRYTGTDASCKISANTSVDTLTSETGVLGAETGDANFGVAGDIDLTAAATDTLGELVTVINGYADYDCEKFFGADALDTADIIDITAKQAKSGWIIVYFSSAASGIYLHQWIVDLTNTERPVYSVQIDGRQDNYLFDGIVADTMALSAALKSFVEAEVTCLGLDELSGQSGSVLTLGDVDPLRFHAGGFSVAEVDYNFIRNHSLNITNSHNPEGFGKGSLARLYHEKGMFGVTGDMQLRLDATSILEYPKIGLGTIVNIFLDYYGQTLATDILERLWIEMPYCILDDFDWVENTGVLDASIPFSVIDKKGTAYNDPFTVSMLTIDSAAY